MEGNKNRSSNMYYGIERETFYRVCYDFFIFMFGGKVGFLDGKAKLAVLKWMEHLDKATGEEDGR